MNDVDARAPLESRRCICAQCGVFRMSVGRIVKQYSNVCRACCGAAALFVASGQLAARGYEQYNMRQTNGNAIGARALAAALALYVANRVRARPPPSLCGAVFVMHPNGRAAMYSEYVARRLLYLY